MVSVFKASNIKISVLVVLCCTCLFQSYNSTAATAPLLCFVAAATAPPLLIGARTRNFTPFVFFRAMSPKPNGKATGSIVILNAFPQDMAMKLPRLLLLLLESFLLSLSLSLFCRCCHSPSASHWCQDKKFHPFRFFPSNVAETKWQSYGFHVYFSCLPSRRGYETAAVAPTIPTVFPALSHFCLGRWCLGPFPDRRVLF